MERELWKMVSTAIRKLERRFADPRLTHSVGRIVRVLLWAALHDRPISWACERRNWVGVRRPTELPDQSTMSRRLRDTRTLELLALLRDELASRLPGSPATQVTLKMLDAKPLPVSRHSLDAEASFGRGAGGIDRGYKFHAIYGENDAPLAWCVRPLNTAEPVAAATLITQLDRPGYLLADAGFDNNALFDRAAEYGQVMLTPRRYAGARGVGHHRHSAHRLDCIARLAAPSPFARELLPRRRAVETRFANLTNFGGGLTHLPPWVRGLHRVTLWVACKLLIRFSRTLARRPAVA